MRNIPTSGEAFRKVYADMVIRKIELGHEHATLGPTLQPGRWEAGKRNFERLITVGVETNDYVVDYGCGTLRVGRHFIDYLDNQKYIGLEIDQRILDVGYSMLETGQQDTQPLLKVIDEDTLTELARLKPKLIFSKGVLHHVPPADIDEYLRNIGVFTQRADAHILICHRVGESTSQVSPVSWQYSLTDLQSAATRNAMTLEPFYFFEIETDTAWYRLSK